MMLNPRRQQIVGAEGMIRLRTNRGRRGMWRAMPLLVFPLLSWLTACDKDLVSLTLPRQMAGTFRTDEAKYQGRFMKLDGDKITFGMGGTGKDRTETVESVSMSPHDKPTDFTVKLKTAEGNPDTILLQFSEVSGELRLKSQPKIVWSRRILPPQTQVAGATPAPGSTPLPPPKVETLTPERIYGDHMTIYKIDCLKPKSCKSY